MSNVNGKRWSERPWQFAQRHVKAVALLLVGVALGAMLTGGRADPASPASEAAVPPSPEPTDGAAAASKAAWSCAMHPQIRQPEPGRCPLCGMELVVANEPHNAGPAADEIVLSPRARRLARLRTSTVQRQTSASGQLRLLGRFEPNETTLKTLTAWTGGRIDRLHANTTGERVRAGQVVATLYSPEVLAAHQDLLVAKRQVSRLKASSPSSRQAAAAALEAARERLQLLGLPAAELKSLEATSRPTRAVAVRSPFSGTVLQRLATEGAYVSTGTPLYRIANLSTLWLQLDAYEGDLARLALQQEARIAVDSLPGETFVGRVTFINPTLDPERRTAQVRVQVGNAGGRLRPGMFAEALVVIQQDTKSRGPLVVPTTAPLFTGRRSIVYLEVESEVGVAYRPQRVRLGPRLGDVYPVVGGLSEGDRVVTRGAFALDADLQIRGGTSMMAKPEPTPQASRPGGVRVTDSGGRALAPVVSYYLEAQVALADDDLAKARRAGTQLLAAVERASLKRQQAQRAWSAIRPQLLTSSRRLAAASSLEESRAAFEPLSEAVIRLLSQLGNPAPSPLRVAFCPMASGSAGARWVQSSPEVGNPYFGHNMLRCGEINQTVGPGEFPAGPHSSDAASYSSGAGRREAESPQP